MCENKHLTWKLLRTLTTPVLFLRQENVTVRGTVQGSGVQSPPHSWIVFFGIYVKIVVHLGFFQWITVDTQNILWTTTWAHTTLYIEKYYLPFLRWSCKPLRGFSVSHGSWGFPWCFEVSLVRVGRISVKDADGAVLKLIHVLF